MSGDPPDPEIASVRDRYLEHLAPMRAAMPPELVADLDEVVQALSLQTVVGAHLAVMCATARPTVLTEEYVKSQEELGHSTVLYAVEAVRQAYEKVTEGQEDRSG